MKAKRTAAKKAKTKKATRRGPSEAGRQEQAAWADRFKSAALLYEMAGNEVLQSFDEGENPAFTLKAIPIDTLAHLALMPSMLDSVVENKDLYRRLQIDNAKSVAGKEVERARRWEAMFVAELLWSMRRGVEGKATGPWLPEWARGDYEAMHRALKGKRVRRKDALMFGVYGTDWGGKMALWLTWMLVVEFGLRAGTGRSGPRLRRIKRKWGPRTLFDVFQSGGDTAVDGIAVEDLREAVIEARWVLAEYMDRQERAYEKRQAAQRGAGA